MATEDTHWDSLCGGYRLPYDPRSALEAIRGGTSVEAAWAELWNELHHQGDVGDASYASVPVLVEIHRDVRHLGWNLYALAACIEIERHRKSNPPLPAWLAEQYRCSWGDLVDSALKDLQTASEPLLIQTALGVCALGRGQLKLGALISYLDTSELDELLDTRQSWHELYSANDAG